jgi:hypothetical protein
MEGLGIAIVFVIFAVIGLAIWFVQKGMDEQRITDYIQERGGRVVSINWAPFGKGWFGDKNDRIYEVVYYDSAGNQHWATCKTNMWSGVYWTDDRVTHGTSTWYEVVAPTNEPGRPLLGQIPKTAAEPEPDELQRLREENARLKEELARRSSGEAPRDETKCPACGAAVTPEDARCPDCRIALR